MKLNIETQFNIGDKVWRKNLVTNEAYETTITDITLCGSVLKNGTVSWAIMYHNGEGPMVNISGRVDANNAFATKEEADACPAYNPK